MKKNSSSQLAQKNNFGKEIKQTISKGEQKTAKKIIRIKKQGKKYSVINKEQRRILIDQIINSDSSITEAAQQQGIKVSTARAIMKVYMNEGRIGKKQIKKKKKLLFTKTIYIISYKQQFSQ